MGAVRGDDQLQVQYITKILFEIMKKWIVSLFLVAVTLSLLLVLLPGRQYVVLVSLDSFRWDYDSLYNTPVLDSIANKGVKAGSLVSSYPTKTFPNHYSIATGLYPDHHGLINNTFYAPDLDLVYRMGDREMVQNGDFYQGEPVWVTARRQGLVTASMFWVGSEAPAGGMHPDYWSLYDGAIPYGARIDSVINWLSMPVKKRPRFITLYFDEPDGTAHSYGPVSPETGRVTESLDSLMGVLVKRLNETPVRRKVNLIILSDHGMAEVDPDKSVNLWEIMPERYIEQCYGGNPVYQVKVADGYADSVIAIVDRTEGIKGWLKEDVPSHYHWGTHPRIPEVLIEAEESWNVVWVPRTDYRRGSRGVHGYDPANRDMHGIFYAIGPSFRDGVQTPSFANVDVYNIICRILNIEPAPNDGDKEVTDLVLR
jgi:alkaline phosphatase D